MMLKPFLEDDYELLTHWISSEELNFLWSGPTFTYPLTLDQIREHYANPEYSPYLFMVDGQRAGFVELYKVEEGHYRICRVFIANEFRGQGLSTTMLSTLIAEAKETFNCSKLSLAVFAHNAPAVASYKSLGFETVEIDKEFLSFSGESWDLLRMEKSFE